MAKARKLTTSQSERFLGSYGSHSHAYLNTGNEPSELNEEDIWLTVDGLCPHDDRSLTNSSRGEWRPRASIEEAHARGLTLALANPVSSPRILHQPPRGGKQMAASAPVNVPEWSTIYRLDSGDSLQDSDDGFEELVPPHEYLARGATSGRTLKGRDLRRVRDAVWSQTGFDG